MDKATFFNLFPNFSCFPQFSQKGLASPWLSARHFAAEMGHVSVVRRLCDLKADVEAEKMQGGGAWGVTGSPGVPQVLQVIDDQ